MKRISRQEWVYLGLALLSIGVLVIAVNTPAVNAKISGLSPIWQFLIMNIGLYVSLLFVAKGVALRKKRSMLARGTLGSMLSFLAIDLILPEFHVSTTGLTVGGIFGASSTDYFFGYLYSTYLGLSGIALVVAVYVVTFAVLFLSGAYLIKNFIRTL